MEQPPTPIPFHSVPISSIIVESNRGRKDFGDVQGLASSIKEIGLLNPPVVVPQGEKYLLKAGERRYRACLVLGWTELIVHFQHEITPFRAKQIELHENQFRKQLDWVEEAELMRQVHEERVKLFGEGGKGQGDAGWNVAKTAAFLDTPVDQVKDRLRIAQVMHERPDIKAAIEHLPLYAAIRKADEMRSTEKLQLKLDSGKLIATQDLLLGDCRELIKQLPDNSIDLLLTDPPFGLEDIEETQGDTRGSTLTYTARVGKTDNLSFKDAVLLMQHLTPEILRVLKPSSHLYIFCSVDLHHELVEVLRHHGFEGFQQLIWDKTKSTTPFKGLQYPRSYEPILFCHKPPRIKHLKDAKSIDILHYAGLHSSKKLHPFQKPAELLQKLIENSSLPGQKILDPFAGSGSTLRIARELNRSCISYELDPNNYARAQAFLAMGAVAQATKKG